MNSITWILVADASRARLFETHKASLFKGNGKKITLVSTHEHSESRKMDSELVTDKQGKFGTGTFVEPTDPKRHEEDRFALELAHTLTKAYHAHLYQDLILISPPAFMGMLKHHLPDLVSKGISLQVERDYTLNTEDEIVEHLQDYL